MNQSRRHVIVLGMVTSLFWFSMYAYTPTFTPYLESLGISYKMIGIIVGSYGFTQMIIRIPLGIYSDNKNRRKLFVIIGLVCSAISSAGLWFFSAAGSILFFRALSGVASSTWVAFTVLFSSYYQREETPRAIGYLTSCTKIGQIFGMLLGGLAAQYFFLQAPFLISLAGVLIAITFSYQIKEKKINNHQKIKVAEIIKVASNKTLLLVSLLAVLYQVVNFATTYGFVPIVARNIGASNMQLGLLSTLTMAAAMLASVLSGVFFARRLGEKNSLILGFTIIALSCIVVPYIKVMSIFYLSQLIGGFGRGLVYPLLLALSILYVDENLQATAMGFFQAIYGLGMFIGPVLLGIIADGLGLFLGFWIMGLIAFIGVLVCAIYLKKVKLVKEAV